MKRKLLFFVTGLAILGLATMQSCKKDEVVTPKEYYAFTTPAVVAPADGETIHITGTTTTLTWESSTQDGTAISANVYFGTSEDPELYQANLNALTLTVPVELGQTYYWRVVMTDVNGITTDGPTWSFVVFEPIGIFVGDYNVDEPAEGWTYDVTFTKDSPTTLAIDAYWASWEAIFTLDFTNNTYTLPRTNFGGGYEGEESGTIDPETGTLVGHYIIYHNGANIEEGQHTYTKL